MDINHRLSSLVALFFLALSCSGYGELEAPRETDWIRFTTGGVFASGEMETKAMEDEITCDITDWEYDEDVDGTKAGLVETVYDSVGVFGYNYSTWSSSALPNMMCNIKSTLNGENLTPDSKVLWKNATSDSVRFYAYAPYNVGTVSGTEYGGVPYLIDTVDKSTDTQFDILYAQSENIYRTNRTAVPLRFKHAKTAVKFRMGDSGDTLQSLTISNVKWHGKLSLDGSWSEVSGKRTFSITKTSTVHIMIPQTLADDAIVTLKYKNSEGSHTIKANIGGTEWPAGKRVVYTLKKKPDEGEVEYVYFDFTAGSIILTDNSYSGYVYVTNADSTAVKVPVTGTPTSSTKYYIYQSAPDTTAAAQSNEKIMSSKTGYASSADIGKKIPTLPQYTPIMVGGKTWGEYITDNTDPAEVLATWNSFPENFLEPGTPHRILICGDAKYDITLDRVYSRYFPYRGSKKGDKYAGVDTSWPNKSEGEEQSYYELYGGITVGIDQLSHQNKKWYELNTTVYKQFNEKVILRLKGDNYFSRIAYSKPAEIGDGYLKITSEKGAGVAEGTLTVTLPYLRAPHPYYSTTLLNLTRCGLIGSGNVSGNDRGASLCYRQVSSIYFQGGIVYIGIEEINNSVWPKNENMMCTIGGINAISRIEISGGILTSISYGSSPAIGGGAGWLKNGGNGVVNITGGTVYAHAFGVYNPEDEIQAPVLSTAIGGGSSGNEVGNSADVTISGGTVYAYSLGGCAIGGGTSAKMKGGTGKVTITGGQVYAKSISGTMGLYDIDAGVAIGGGRSGTLEGNGGDANMKVTGGKIIAGSVGGGKCGNSIGKLGKATVSVSGGEISAQFLLVTDPSGATSNKFTMSKGTISNSSTFDSEYTKAMPNGGAVYMESGTCTISGGTISNCIGSLGGAVYMNGGTFKMTGGKIADCKSETDGGAVYVEGGDAHVDGGQIYHNIASKGNGGGVYIKGGNFSMKQGGTGKILNNAADCNPIMVGGSYYGGNGGGIYISSTTSNPTVDIFGGKIQYNAADRNGGGLCIDMPDPAHSASIKIGYSGGTYVDPDISLNSAALSGGGMSVQGSGSNIEIYCGTVKGNVSAIVKNEDIRNDGGTVDLLGKNIPGETPQVNVLYNTIHYYANNGDDPEPNDEQRVITATNSPLHPTAKALAFEKEFYHLVSWNTRRDGTGTAYDLNGTDAVMNITTDVNLYGQWVRNQ